MTSREKMLDMFEKMVRTRDFDNKAKELSFKGKLSGNLHCYTWQEAIASGVCGALELEDKIMSTHRGHGHMIAKGGNLNEMMAELFGRTTGCCKGKGGSMHIADFSIGSLGANGIVGGGLAIAAGAAMSIKMDGKSNVVGAFLGDGAINQGLFYECLNMAQLWKLPILYVVEMNNFAVCTPTDTVCAGDPTKRGDAFEIYSHVVDGQNLAEVYEKALDCVNYMRAGRGPTLLWAKTYRIGGHISAEDGLMWGNYRPDGELEKWRDKDPIVLAEKYIISSGIATEDEINRIKDGVACDIAAAVEFSEKSPFPTEADIYTDIWA